MPEIPFTNNNYYIDPPAPTFHEGTGFIDRFVAAEIEVAGVSPKVYDTLDKVIRKWKGEIKGDGSLPQGGFEITTAPAKGDKFEKQIRDICAVLKEGKVRLTRACGLHIHVDARDLGPEDIIKIAMLWKKVEPALFEKVSKSRKTNTYCRPWANSELATGIEFPLKATDFIKFSRDSYDRYHAMNFSALEKYGTLENRMHQGTANPTKIINWATINFNIINYAINHSYKQIHALKNVPKDIWNNTKVVRSKSETQSRTPRAQPAPAAEFQSVLG